MTPPIPVSLRLCNEHLQSLYRAIERDDIVSVYQIEHELTEVEECVACAYALKAKGTVREVLDSFLQKEGFQVDLPTKFTRLGEVKFWTTRMGIFGGLLTFFIGSGGTVKNYFTEGRELPNLGSFGIVGAIILAITVFVLIDSLLLEE